MGIEAEDLKPEENIDLAALANAEDQEVVIEEESKLSETEQKAFDQGWRPQADFEGPEDNWKTAKEYVRDGEFLATIRELNQKVDNQKADFDQRLQNSNKLHEARRLKEISDLETQKRDAVRTSDTEAYDDAEEQIKKLEETPAEVKPATTDRSAVDEWMKKNPWINEKSNDKANFAGDTWDGYIKRNPSATDEQDLAHVDSQLERLYPTSNDNPRRSQQNSNETPAKRGKKGSKALTMNDLTQDEKNEWVNFGSMFKNEAAFLKAAKDARVS